MYQLVFGFLILSDNLVRLHRTREPVQPRRHPILSPLPLHLACKFYGSGLLK